MRQMKQINVHIGAKKNKQYTLVVSPEVIKEYNSKMGGVDMVDRLLADCPFYKSHVWLSNLKFMVIIWKDINNERYSVKEDTAVEVV